MDRRKKGSKHHLITDAEGVPLAVGLTGGNRHDVTQLIPLVDAIPPIGGKLGRPVRRPAEVYADRAYDSDPHRRQLAPRGIAPEIAEQNTEHGSRPGVSAAIITTAWIAL